MATLLLPANLARRTIGIILLAATVFLWTASNFLLSDILADDSYTKPYFVTYVNTAFFSLFLGIFGIKYLVLQRLDRRKLATEPTSGQTRSEEAESFLHDVDHHANPVFPVAFDDGLRRTRSSTSIIQVDDLERKLTVKDTAYLAVEFCFLWFFANFTLAVGLQYTNVASSTVLTATSSMWTLLFGVVVKVERFSMVKLLGIAMSLAGITMISMVDFSGETDKHRGSFPHKNPGQIALGDVLSVVSAILYGAYAVFMKKRIGSEDRIDMVLFFGFVGVISTAILWPGLVFLHFVGLEPFEMPPTSRITLIIIINSIVSTVADLCWAYAVVLTSPLVVTVGLSMSIPLALFGQMIIHSSSSSIPYWIGALLVVAAFSLINYESKQIDDKQPTAVTDIPRAPHGD